MSDSSGVRESTHNKEHHRPDGTFQNPWSTWRDPAFTAAMKWMVTRRPPPFPAPNAFEVVKPNWDFLYRPDIHGAGRRFNALSCTWIGHASLYCTIDGTAFLTDPVWSERCSPVQIAGPARYVRTPCDLSEIQQLDFVLVSHNHYDHLDLNTVREIGNRAKWIVPLGLKSWFHATDIQNVVELDWWESHKINDEITVTAVPCQHWSRRSALDKNATLWASYVVTGPKHKAYFSGDTGYCEVFNEVGRLHGPFDLAMLPIGAYEPRCFMRPQHVDPEEAVKMHIDLQSKFSIGMHWGTFILTDEPVDEPPKKLKEAMEKAKLNPETFVTTRHGETVVLSRRPVEASSHTHASPESPNSKPLDS